MLTDELDVPKPNTNWKIELLVLLLMLGFAALTWVDRHKWHSFWTYAHQGTWHNCSYDGRLAVTTVHCDEGEITLTREKSR